MGATQVVSFHEGAMTEVIKGIKADKEIKE